MLKCMTISRLSEWRVTVLRPECADLRQRAAEASEGIREELKVADDQVESVKALIAEAKKRGCRLSAENMDMAAGAQRRTRIDGWGLVWLD
jgi:hypothetical protein